VLKEPNSLEALEREAVRLLQDVLARVPPVRVQETYSEPERGGVDFEIVLEVNGTPHRLICEVKSNGQPRYVREAIFQLDEFESQRADQWGKPTKVFVAPFLSEEARAICRDHDVGYLDFEGNAWLAFDGIYIETSGPRRSKPEKRELKSVFAPKSTQVLHRMLREPGRFWRLADLARAAHVSLGHVSNVKQSLLDREWGYADEHGLRLVRPDALLDAWRDAYEPPAGERLSFYTTLHGKELEHETVIALSVANDRGDAMLSSFSAAKYLSPFGRHPTTFFYADRRAVAALSERLQLRPVPDGGNVLIVVPENRGLFLEKDTPAPDVSVSGAVLTYLDLSAQGERGREAAEHLRQSVLVWPNSW